jgi:hypothetical protein
LLSLLAQALLLATYFLFSIMKLHDLFVNNECGLQQLHSSFLRPEYATQDRKGEGICSCDVL